MARWTVVKTDGGIVPVGESHLELAAKHGLRIVEVDGSDIATLSTGVTSLDEISGLLALREQVSGDILRSLPSLRVVARLGVGVDSVDLASARDLGLVVTNVPYAATEEVALHAVAMILSLVRRLPNFDRDTRNGTWSYRVTGAGMKRASELTLGLVGLGHIGLRVAQLAAGLGFRVIGYDPFAVPEAIDGLGARVDDLPALAATADVVSVHVPLNDHTRGIIDAQFLAQLQPGAMIVNVSRGGLVDEEALADALDSGHLSGAALDTFSREPLPPDSRLWHTDKLVISPHAAHYSLSSEREKLEVAIEDVGRVLDGGSPQFGV